MDDGMSNAALRLFKWHREHACMLQEGRNSGRFRDTCSQLGFSLNAYELHFWLMSERPVIQVAVATGICGWCHGL